MTQDEIYDQVFEKYKTIFPDMKHGSGGLPDAQGEGTSDVDICIFSRDYASLGKYFPPDTEIDSGSPNELRPYTIYKLRGYPREVNVYCTDGDWWRWGYLHRQTELALRERFPVLATEAFAYKKSHRISTVETWAYILGLGENWCEVLLDTEESLSIAEAVSKDRAS